MTAKEVIKILRQHGWYEIKSNSGSHLHFKHDKLPGKITVPYHKGDIKPGTLKSIMKYAQINWPL